MNIHRRNKPSATRQDSAHVRLTNALATLTGRTTPMQARVSVAELCRLAKVSRNSLYRYHAPILAALRKHQRRPSSVQAKALHSAEQRRRENHDLHQRLAKLAALADHYFSAYRQAAMLLDRRERELAGLRAQLSARPTALQVVPASRHARL